MDYSGEMRDVCCPGERLTWYRRTGKHHAATRFRPFTLVCAYWLLSSSVDAALSVFIHGLEHIAAVSDNLRSCVQSWKYLDVYKNEYVQDD